MLRNILPSADQIHPRRSCAIYVATEREDSLHVLCKESESERNGGCQKYCQGHLFVHCTATFDIADNLPFLFPLFVKTGSICLQQQHVHCTACLWCKTRPWDKDAQTSRTSLTGRASEDEISPGTKRTSCDGLVAMANRMKLWHGC